jgi:uncharacterized protein
MPQHSIARPPCRAPEHEVIIQRAIMVTMRDGVRLATDVYLPAKDSQALPGPWPALLERTPYSKLRSQTNTPDGRFWASRGYVFVVQDCRGRFGSE